MSVTTDKTWIQIRQWDQASCNNKWRKQSVFDVINAALWCFTSTVMQVRHQRLTSFCLGDDSLKSYKRVHFQPIFHNIHIHTQSLFPIILCNFSCFVHIYIVQILWWSQPFSCGSIQKIKRFLSYTWSIPLNNVHK